MEEGGGDSKAGVMRGSGGDWGVGGSDGEEVEVMRGSGRGGGVGGGDGE